MASGSRSAPRRERGGGLGRGRRVRPRPSAAPRPSACARKASIPFRAASRTATGSPRSSPPTTPSSWGRASTAEFSYRIAGRVTGKRGHGKTVFFDVRDLTGTIQAYARVDALGEEAFGRIEDLDIGDVVGIEGDLYVTKRGQLALGVRECTLLAKALRDPPDLFHGISDPDTRYRQRELDLMANERSREVFKLRAKLTGGDPRAT